MPYIPQGKGTRKLERKIQGGETRKLGSAAPGLNHFMLFKPRNHGLWLVMVQEGRTCMNSMGHEVFLDLSGEFVEHILYTRHKNDSYIVLQQMFLR